MESDASLELYLRRIGLACAPVADPSGLALLQAAHRQTIGFENLDVRLGREILLDHDAIFDKLVTRGRGGYCFEQNRLYARMLDALGFPNRYLLARVLLGPPAPSPPPRTHVLLLVDMDGEPWLADAGFGGSFVPPMPLLDGAEAMTGDGARHRLRAGEGGTAGDWLLERAGPPEATDGRAAPHRDWQAQYSFEMAEVADTDLAMGNHWTSSHPSARFTQVHVASIALPAGYASMVERTLTVHDAGETTVREIESLPEYGEVLREVMRIDLPAEDAALLPLFAS